MTNVEPRTGQPLRLRGFTVKRHHHGGDAEKLNAILDGLREFHGFGKTCIARSHRCPRCLMLWRADGPYLQSIIDENAAAAEMLAAMAGAGGRAGHTLH